jgi:replicative DNA helicase
MDNELSHQERLERSQIAFTALSSEKQASTQVDIKTSLITVLDSLDRRLNGQEDGMQIKTGLSDIDDRIQGFREGDLILVGARPSMGKTTYMTNIAKHVAQYHGKVMIFSLEMTHESLTQRLIACCGKANMGMLRDPKSASHDPSFWPKVSTGAQIVRELPIVIDDQGGLSLPQVCSRARREHRKSPIKMIMVDYIQKMNDGDRKNANNKNLEVGNISSGLKNLAKELGCPVVALSQLNRGLESRTDKRPNNSDLRDSGNLEQDADVIQFLYRDEIYDEGSSERGVLEVITSKFRDGEVGTDRLSFEGKYNLITDLDASKFAQQQQEHESQGKKSGFKY